MVVYLDDPPPMRWSQDIHAKFAPEDPASGNIDEQQCYPKTPFMDFMSTKGMRYSRATNTAVCSSGRASLQTGQYPTVHGVGTIIRSDRNGDLAEFGDAGFDTGTPLAESLGTGVYKGWIGKVHLSLADANNDPAYNGLEWTIADTGGAGRLGTWDKRTLWLNNSNQHPLPDGVIGAVRGGDLTDGNVADDANQTTGGGSHYFYRYREGTQQRNMGTLASPGSGGHTPANSNGVYGETLMVNEAISFWQTVAAQAEPGFLLFTPHLPHAPYDLPPPHTSPTTSQGWYDLAISDPAAVPVWVRQQAMTSAMDHELHRLYAGLPPEIRDNLVTIVCADNGIDGFYLDSLYEDGNGQPNSNIPKDLGAHWANAYEESRAKSTLFWAGIKSQMFAFGPGIAAGTTDALVEVGPDLHETIVTYFGETSGDGVGVDFSNTWDGTVQLADHDRLETQHSYFWPHGSPNPATETKLANKALWNDAAASYDYGDEVYWVDAAGDVPTNWVCTSTAGDPPVPDSHVPSTVNRPGDGTGNWEAHWERSAERHVAVTKYYPEAVSGDPVGKAGVWKLYRRLHDVLEGDNVTDLLYHTHDVDGVPIDEFEMDPLDVTHADNNATYAALDMILDAINV